MTNQMHTATTIQHQAEIQAEIDAGALFVVNHSGGKDSQAMYAVITSMVPADQIVVVHADLGDDVEHLGVLAHIEANVDHEVHVAQAIWKDGTRKTLLDAIERRGSWPSSAARYCTSDLKRGPCEKVIRRLADAAGRNRVVSCFGFRAEESAARSKRPTWSMNKKNTNSKRTWFELNPIHDLTTAEVFQVIAAAGQEPHPVYAEGNERLSCVFCVLGSKNDLQNGARLRPDLARRYIELEKKMGHTFRADASLEEILDLDPEDDPEGGEEVNILSFGGGVDSTALLAIHLNRNTAAARLGISRQELDAKFPPVDAVVFSDPGAEFPGTYENVEYARGRCEGQGLRFETVRKHETILEWMGRLGNIPLMPGCGHVCSLKFKAEVLHKWAEAEYAGTIHWAIGIEANETNRSFTSAAGERHQCHHPLVELGLTRADCERILDELGWGIQVRKSSCSFCPFQTEDELRDLHDNHPELWAQAQDIEDRFEQMSRIKHQAWLDAVAAGTTDPDKRAPTGQWKKDSFAAGARLFSGKRIDGKRLSVREWSERFTTTTTNQ